MSEPLDPEELLRSFSAVDLRYVVVGGLAVNAYGFIRATKDIDICPDPARSNLERLAGLLSDLEVTQNGAEDFDDAEMPFDPRDVDDLAQGGNFRLQTRLGDLDVMQWLPGISGDLAYPALAAKAMVVEMDGLSVPVCSLAHLRCMKRAAGRPQDLEDLDKLAALHGDETD